MAAAADLFRERGFRETSLADIGAAAGVSGPAIYRYFKSKGELLSVLIEEAALLWRGTVDEVLNEDTPPLVTLERLIDAAIELQLRNGNLRDVFVQSYRSLDDDARRRVARIERVRTAEWAHVLHEVRPGLTDEEARAAVHMVDGMLRSVTTLAMDREALARVAKDMVFGGLLSVGITRSAAEILDVSLDEEEFRAEVLTFLRATLPPKGQRGPEQDQGGGPGQADGRGIQRAVAFQRALADAGLAGITWPSEYGGRGLPGRYQRIFDQEARAFQVPPRSLEIGLGMCGPTVLVHGSEEQKRALVPSLLRGEHVWCELFSEPGAGSDLSSVQTRARRDGDEFIVDGQKVWTSGAQHSDYAACLTRTDPNRPKREGITMLHRRHARARHHRAPPAPAHRRVPLQRGLPRRRARPRGQRPRADRRRVAGRPHHARLRTPGPQRHRLERRLAGRLRRPGRRGQAAPGRRASGLSRPLWCSCAFSRWSCAT